jgi:hypothetical protein
VPKRRVFSAHILNQTLKDSSFEGGIPNRTARRDRRINFTSSRDPEKH